MATAVATAVKALTVTPRSAADGIINVGDTLLAVNGVAVTDLRQGAALIRSSVGEVVLTIIRDGVEGAQIVYKPSLETLTGVTWEQAGPPEVNGVPTTVARPVAKSEGHAAVGAVKIVKGVGACILGTLLCPFACLFMLS